MHSFSVNMCFQFSFITAILVNVKWYLIVFWICISLMTSETNDIEHLFMLLLAIFVPLLEVCLVKSLTHFEIGIFVFSLMSCMSSSCIFRYKSLVKHVICK